ncbi:hypothetical protein GCM10017784_23820 [Deinococcus indicus]|nr:hypothetical protein GCM10017784_23820 [Deinococcus indicus]
MLRTLFKRRREQAWNTSSVTPCLLTPSQPPPSKGRGKHSVFIAGLPGSHEPVRTMDDTDVD